MPAKTSDIVQHEEADPADATWLAPRGPEALEVVEAKAAWASAFGLVAQQLRAALDDEVLVAVEHVGSTAVPGLAARDVLDVDVVVAAPADEAAYARALADAGFGFVPRAPPGPEPRLFVRAPPPGQQPVQLRVFGPDAPALVRHRLFRNRLRTHAADRARYEAAKRDAARATRDAGGGVPEYNARKQAVIRDILEQAYREHGLLMP